MQFTKEQLIAKLQHRLTVAAKYPDVEEAELDAAIFKIALASLEAGSDRKQVDELTMWVKRLAHSLKYANQLSKLPDDAMDYLSRKGLISVEDVLR